MKNITLFAFMTVLFLTTGCGIHPKMSEMISNETFSNHILTKPLYVDLQSKARISPEGLANLNEAARRTLKTSNLAKDVSMDSNASYRLLIEVTLFERGFVPGKILDVAYMDADWILYRNSEQKPIASKKISSSATVAISEIFEPINRYQAVIERTIKENMKYGVQWLSELQTSIEEK